MFPEAKIVEELLSKSKELPKEISKKMKVALKTLKKYSEYIENAVTYEYSNGAIE